MRSEESINSKTVRIGPQKYNLCHHEPSCISLGLILLITHFKVYQMCCQANPMCSLSSKTQLLLSGLETILLKHLKEDQRSIFHLWPSEPFLFHFQLSYCGLIYFHLTYSIFNLFRWLSFWVISNYSNNMQCLIT